MALLCYSEVVGRITKVIVSKSSAKVILDINNTVKGVVLVKKNGDVLMCDETYENIILPCESNKNGYYI